MSAPHLQAQAQAFKAGADLSAHQFKLVKYGSSPQEVILCGNAEKPCGILMNAPKSGELAEVAIAGGFKTKVTSVVDAGKSCASGASGVGRAAVAGEWAIGMFQDNGVSGDVVPVQIDFHQLNA
jgi:hypothetical protein